MTLLWLLSVLPRALVSWFLLLLLFGLLPPLAERAAWTVCLALLLASAFPRVEGWSARLLEGARPPEAEERWHLAPVVARAEQLGVRVDRILIRRRPGVLTRGRSRQPGRPRNGRRGPSSHHRGGGRPDHTRRGHRRVGPRNGGETGAGRPPRPGRPGLLRCRVRQRRWRVGSPSPGWSCRRPVCRGGCGSWSPALRWSRASRTGSTPPESEPQCLVALTYLTPAADRAWQALRCAAADKRVTEIGMGPVLLQLLNRMQIVVSRRRLARLRTTSTEPRKLALPNLPIGGLPWTGYRSREAT